MLVNGFRVFDKSADGITSSTSRAGNCLPAKRECGGDYSTTARTSSSRISRNSVPSISTVSPAYELKNNRVAVFQLSLAAAAVVEQFSAAGGNDGSAGRLFTRRVGKHDAACGDLFTFFALNHNSFANGLQTNTGLFLGGSCHRGDSCRNENQFLMRVVSETDPASRLHVWQTERAEHRPRARAVPGLPEDRRSPLRQQLRRDALEWV